MEIAKDRVVTLQYTLKDDQGRVLDTSDNQEPLSYLHGYGQMIPGVEKNLEGKKSGDVFDIEVAPDEGYGEYNERLITSVKRNQLEADAKPAVGMAVEAEGPDGMHLLRITKIEGDMISLDGNHPLAGKKLFFNLSVVGVREATAEEKEHGHLHGEGCCHGDEGADCCHGADGDDCCHEPDGDDCCCGEDGKA